ncbi:NADH-quinone oxidoreductase subunit C [bacterium]|nr:NADH-quinone oxidoreductase subunit C [bacterium]
MPVRNGEREERSKELLARLQDKLGSYLVRSELSLGDAEVEISAESAGEFFRLLKLDSELGFNVFLDVTAVDWMDSRDERFELVYHLMSHPRLDRIRVKISLPESSPKVASVAELWAAANFMEREVYDMYGIDFIGHPDQRRILMYDEFTGYPLRKDYPVQGKQPRIPLRSPEVENTARQMNRESLSSGLVQIGQGRIEQDLSGQQLGGQQLGGQRRAEG